MLQKRTKIPLRTKTAFSNKAITLPLGGSSINDVSSKGEGGCPPSKPIYYIFSNLSQQGEEGGS